MTLSADVLKQRACDRIQESATEIAAISRDVADRAETGFREHSTAALVKSRLEEILPASAIEEGLAVTGVSGRIEGRNQDFTVAILGEMDALISPDHPRAVPSTGAAHVCGHNAQIASMLGAGIGLASVADHLDGTVLLFAVPAEECIELGWRLEQRAENHIEFLVGKPELIRLGKFDDVKVAMMAHTLGPAEPLAFIGGETNGATVHRATFEGRQAHAGAAPWDGVNAYKALTLALSALEAQRETFRDEDNVRVHSLVTETGASLTTVPATASVDIMVRARTVEALQRVAYIVQRALRAGAVAFGARVRVETAGIYLPMGRDEGLENLAYANARALFSEGHVERTWGQMSGSTDMGDLGMIMPVLHPYVPAGTPELPHSDRYEVVDPQLAAVNAAKLMACTTIDLLVNGASQGYEVVRNAGPKLSITEYLAMRRSLDGLMQYGPTS